MGFYSRAFLVFLMNESKKRRRKQPGKLMAKSRSQPVNLPGARPLMNPLRLASLVLLHCFTQRTSMSFSPCPGLLKCSATGKPGGFLVMAQRCSPVHSLSIRLVSPMYRTGQRQHEIDNIAGFAGEMLPHGDVVLWPSDDGGG